MSAPDLPDLAALRADVEFYSRPPSNKRMLVDLNVLSDVLALVDTLQADNERLRAALASYGRHHSNCPYVCKTSWGCSCGLNDALSVPPAEKTHPPAAARKEPR